MMKAGGAEIRIAALDDAEPISTLVTAVSRSFITPDLPPDGRKRLLASMTPAAIRQYMRAGYRYHVACAHGSIVGVVATRDDRHIYHLFVDGAWQGRGLGRRLWSEASAACVRAGNPGEFTVNSSLNAVQFYEQFGFVRQSGPVVHGGVIAVPMRLRVVAAAPEL